MLVVVFIIFLDIYTQQSIANLPFEINTNRNHSAVADQFTVDKQLLNNSTPSINLNQFLDTIVANLFAILKICIITISLLVIAFIILKVYTQKGTVVLPFEISNISLSGVAIADQLTAELVRIQQIHAVKYEDLVLRLRDGVAISKFSTEQSLGDHQLVVPKTEIVEFNMGDIGNVDVGVGSLSLGKLMIAFKNICPGSTPVATIRGCVQKYGATITLVAILESKTIRSWKLSQTIENGNEIHQMVVDVAFMIAHDLQRSSLSVKTWKGLEYYTEALDAYHQYSLSGDTSSLSLAVDYSLEAIRSERGYESPYDLLSLLENTYIAIGEQINAIECCNKTIELDHTSPYAWYNKGRALLIQGKHDEAIQAYDKAIELDPKDALPWNNKGIVLNNQGKHDEANAAFAKAKELRYTD